jgi:hypothetical protein
MNQDRRGSNCARILNSAGAIAKMLRLMRENKQPHPAWRFLLSAFDNWTCCAGLAGLDLSPCVQVSTPVRKLNCKPGVSEEESA